MAKKRKKRRPRRPREPLTEAPARAAAPAPRPKRPSVDDRPPAPWGSFPLVELAVFIGIVILLIGLIGGGDRGPLFIFVGLALASVGGLELAIREHFAGYRSHSTLLASIPSLAVLAGLFYAGPESLPPLARVAIALVVGGASFWLLVRVFREKAGVSVKLR